MNRRNFLERTAALSVVLAGLPLASKKKNQKTPAHYYGKTDYQYPDSDTILSDLSLSLFHETIEGFDKAMAPDKIITIRAYRYATKEKAATLNAFEYTFEMSGVSKDKKEEGTLIVKTNNAQKTSGDINWPSVLPKNPVIKIVRGAHAELLNKKNESFVRLAYKTYSDDSDDMGCFITTACVTERNLADDCDELNTLRYLRENYMRKTGQGNELVKEYSTLGPAVVTAIAGCENRSAIYDYLYTHMILPAVSLIKNGKYQEAVDWYEGFAVQLRKNYC